MRWRAVLVAGLVLVSLSACITSGSLAPSDPESQVDSPLLSWWGDSATTIAVTWVGEPRVSAVAVRDDSQVSVSQAERDGLATRALIQGLKPDTRYEYQGRDDSGLATGPWRSFTTGPGDRAEAPDTVLRFVVAGDIQPFNEETERTTRLAMGRIAALHPSFFVQIGDITEYGFRRKSWRLSASVLSDAAGESPIVATAGNHDYYGLRRAPYFKEVFPAPYASEEPGTANTWYATDYGPVHIAVLDTEAKGNAFDEQLEWLDSDLARASANGSWIFVAMHRPAVSMSIYAPNSRLAQALVPVFSRHGVHAVFWGHDHTYEHYEYRYGANGLVFNPLDVSAERPIHLFTVGTSGARVDSLYAGFLTHRPRITEYRMFDRNAGSWSAVTFEQRSWNPARVRRDEPGVRFQDPDIYPGAASYYHFPFEPGSGPGPEARYSSDPAISYSDAAEFFGYSYGETSLHYLLVEISGDTCTISAHYLDGPAGEPGPVITRPDGGEERWVITR